MTVRERVQTAIHEFGSAAGRFFILLCVLVAWFLFGICCWLVYHLVPVFLLDLTTSVQPLLAIGVSSAVAWFLSVQSSASELLLGFLNKQLLDAFRQKVPETLLPFVEERQIHILSYFNLTMMVYDIVTNIWGSWNLVAIEGGTTATRVIATLITTFSITFSEFFLVATLALAAVCFMVAIKFTVILLPSLRRDESG